MARVCWPELYAELEALREDKQRTHALQRKCAASEWEVADRADSALARLYECKLCFDRPIEAVFLPCGHAMACAECAAQPACPACGMEVQAVTRVCFL